MYTVFYTLLLLYIGGYIVINLSNLLIKMWKQVNQETLLLQLKIFHQILQNGKLNNIFNQ